MKHDTDTTLKDGKIKGADFFREQKIQRPKIPKTLRMINLFNASLTKKMLFVITCATEKGRLPHGWCPTYGIDSGAALDMTKEPTL
jgi:hypothetical protein